MDEEEDKRLDSGSNSLTSTTVKIKVLRIKAVKLLSTKNDKSKYSKPLDYWYYKDSGVVYDFDLKFPLGQIAVNDNGIPLKLDKKIYIIDKLIPIPMLDDE